MNEDEKLVNKNTPPAETEPAEEIGDIRVADQVISIVASLAAQEVNGVLCMSSGFREGLNEFLGKEQVDKGVRVVFDGKIVHASVYIIIEYNYSIPEVALEVQEKVKDAIENMTGYDVETVDVHVEGVRRREKTELELDAEKEVFPSTAIDIFENDNEEERHRRFFEED